VDRPRRAELAELRQLVEKQLRGPIADHVKERVQNKMGRWNDPAARLERRKARAVSATWLWVFLGLVLGIIAAVAITGGGIGAQDLLYGLFVGVASLASFVMAGRSGLRLRALNRVQLPAAAPTLPPRGSLAREPMERLADSERALAELLRNLSSPRSSVPADTVTHARDTGAEAASALREVAGQLQSVERARDLANARDRAPLSEGVRRLREQLDQGLDGYGSLIAAAGQLVAASSTGGPDKQALTDASDRLHGLAVALRELFPDRA
jgi:hypothetical protein